MSHTISHAHHHDGERRVRAHVTVRGPAHMALVVDDAAGALAAWSFTRVVPPARATERCHWVQARSRAVLRADSPALDAVTSADSRCNNVRGRWVQFAAGGGATRVGDDTSAVDHVAAALPAWDGGARRRSEDEARAEQRRAPSGEAAFEWTFWLEWRMPPRAAVPRSVEIAVYAHYFEVWRKRRIDNGGGHGGSGGGGRRGTRAALSLHACQGSPSSTDKRARARGSGVDDRRDQRRARSSHLERRLGPAPLSTCPPSLDGTDRRTRDLATAAMANTTHDRRPPTTDHGGGGGGRVARVATATTTTHPTVRELTETEPLEQLRARLPPWAVGAEFARFSSSLIREEIALPSPPPPPL